MPRLYVTRYDLALVPSIYAYIYIYHMYNIYIRIYTSIIFLYIYISLYTYHAIVEIMQDLWTHVGTHYLHTVINQQPP